MEGERLSPVLKPSPFRYDYIEEYGIKGVFQVSQYILQ
jgi:hypothetical protein